MASESNNHRGRTRQLNINEMYIGRISSQLSIESCQETPWLERSEIFPHNMDNESKLN